MPEERICSDCGAKLSSDAQGGLCVRCLFTLGLKTEAGTEAPAAPITEKPGDRIGRYKLLQKIGEGGCGVVYLTEQEEPVRRKVALKVIKLGMDTREVIARFEAERQALAMMDHPNIAKVHDGGATDAGRPYFVMELVKGTRITEYCDQHNLPTRERLGLFIKVCQAIQHAHQKGIIHRDIKPSNILVTVNDGVPVPKVIDFGIAKATEGRLTDKTLFTAFQQFMGTPAYMSPEQAEMTSLDIDTRSDIYSLGVLLYELLTGKTPFDAKELLAAGIDAMRRTIREVEPLKPSTRLTQELVAAPRQSAADSAGANGGALPRRRYGEIQGLIHALRGDLDWIVMKCLEKDRTRRYETANAVALDIRRFLDHEPVSAAAPSSAYRIGKFARRNKVALGVAAALVVILFIATVASTWQAMRATQARQEAEAISTFLTEVFQSPDPARNGRTITVAETLDLAVKKLGIDLANQPVRRAQLQSTLGRTYHALGLAREGIPLQEKARDFWLATYGPEHPATLSAVGDLMVSYHEAGRRGEALKMGEELLTLSRKVLGPKHPTTLSAMANLAVFYRAAGRREAALKLREEVLALSRKVLGPKHPTTLSAMGNLAQSYSASGRRDEATRLREEVLMLSSRALGPQHPDTLAAMANVANSYYSAGRRDEALKLRQDVLVFSRTVNGQEHPATVGAMANLAISRAAAGHHAEALKLREQVLALRRKANGQANPDILSAMANLAQSYLAVGRRAEALQLREEVLVLSRELNGAEHTDTLSAMHNLAISCADAGRWSEALKLREEVLALSRKAKGPEHPDTLSAMGNLAVSYHDAGRRKEALALREEVLAGSRKVSGPEHPNTLSAMANLAQSYFTAKRWDEALKLREVTLSLRRKVLGPGHPDTLSVMQSLAYSYQVQRRYAEAEPLYRGILQGHTTNYPSTNDIIVADTSDLAGLLYEWSWSERHAVDKTKAAERAREAVRLLRGCLATYAKTFPAESSRLAETRSRLGAALVAVAVIDSTLTAKERLASLLEAEPLLLEPAAALEADARVSSAYKRERLERLVRLYESWPKPEQLAKWTKKLDEAGTAAAAGKGAGTGTKKE